MDSYLLEFKAPIAIIPRYSFFVSIMIVIMAAIIEIGTKQSMDVGAH